MSKIAGERVGGARTAGRAALIGALGVVFGDIGTSPIYTVQTVFSPGDPHPVAATTESIFGIISLTFWSVTIVVTVTYVLLVMCADNDGEGGIMALIMLIRQRVGGGRRTTAVLAALGIFGAALFFGDSMITPAISVLSAVEGLKVAAPSLGNVVVPITAAIIVVLFLAQRLGTAIVGRLFGPVMIVWFLAIGACGVRGIAQHPEILKALSPTYAASFLVIHFGIAFFALAAVVLAVTGVEALYADMGHFGRRTIVRAWLVLVFPACILSYLGQGALVLGDPGRAISSPFFLLVPAWGRLPMVFLATRHGHRLAGGNHRSILGRPAGGAARLPSALTHRSHLRRDDRADLCAAGQLGAAGLRPDTRVRISYIRGARILSVDTLPVPYVPAAEQLVVDDLGYSDDGITYVGARFGYMDRINIPELLRMIEPGAIERPLELDDVSYFLSKIQLRPSNAPGLPRWRKHLSSAHLRSPPTPRCTSGFPRHRRS